MVATAEAKASKRELLKYKKKIFSGGSIRYRELGRAKVWSLSELEPFQYILHKDNKGIFTKDNVAEYSAFQAFADLSLFTATGEEHTKRRKAVQKAFKPEIIKNIVNPIIIKSAYEAVDEAIATEGPVDIAAMMRNTGAVIICKSLATDIDKETSIKLANDVSILMDSIAKPSLRERLRVAFWEALGRPTKPRIRLSEEMQQSATEVRSIISNIVDRRYAAIQEGEDGLPQDMIQILLEQVTEGGLTVDDVKHEVLTLLIAGHETTAIALTNTARELHRNLRVRNLMIAEIDQVLGNREITADDIKNLPYTMACAKESMRLHPPARSVIRRAQEDAEVPGMPEKVKKGNLLYLGIKHLHMNPKIWIKPEKYAPARFFRGSGFYKQAEYEAKTYAERDKAREGFPAGAWKPFSSGDANCIGAGMALNESVIMLAVIFQRASIRYTKDTFTGTHPSFTERPNGELEGNFVERRKIEPLHLAAA